MMLTEDGKLSIYVFTYTILKLLVHILFAIFQLRGYISLCFSRSRSASRGSLFAVGGGKNHPSTTSLDTPNSHPGSRRTSKPCILLEPDPEIYGREIKI